MELAILLITSISLVVSLWSTGAFGKPRVHMDQLLYFVTRRTATHKVIWITLTANVSCEQYYQDIRSHRGLSDNDKKQFELLVQPGLDDPWPVIEEVYRSLENIGLYMKKIGKGEDIKLYGWGGRYRSVERGVGFWSAGQNLKSDTRAGKHYVKKYHSEWKKKKEGEQEKQQ